MASTPDDSGSRIVPTQTSPSSLQFQNGAVFSFVSPRGRSSLSSARTDNFPPATLNTNGGTGYCLPFKSRPAPLLAEEEGAALRRRPPYQKLRSANED